MAHGDRSRQCRRQSEPKLWAGCQKPCLRRSGRVRARMRMSASLCGRMKAPLFSDINHQYTPSPVRATFPPNVRTLRMRDRRILKRYARILDDVVEDGLEPCECAVGVVGRFRIAAAAACNLFLDARTAQRNEALEKRTTTTPSCQNKKRGQRHSHSLQREIRSRTLSVSTG